MTISSLFLSLVPGWAGVENGPDTATRSGSVRNTLHLFGDSRLRYDYADIDGLDTSTLGSLRTRFGVKTDVIAGFEFLAEGEHTWVLTDTDGYRPGPGFGPADHAVIADPDNFQLNRLQLSYLLDSMDTT